jgi:hypothetical protein
MGTGEGHGAAQALKAVGKPCHIVRGQAENMHIIQTVSPKALIKIEGGLVPIKTHPFQHLTTAQAGLLGKPSYHDPAKPVVARDFIHIKAIKVKPLAARKG